MFKWFGNWIRKQLGITDLQQQLKMTQDELAKASNDIRDLTHHKNLLFDENTRLSKQIGKSASQYNALMELVDLGLDVNMSHSRYTNGPSICAVVCFAGTFHYIKFYVLGDDEMQSIHEFLQPFDRANRVVDAAPHIKRFLYQ